MLLLRPVLPRGLDRTPSLDHLGPGLGQLGRRPLVKGPWAAWIVEEDEEEEVSQEVDRRGHPCWSMAAAMGQSFQWAHWSSEVVAAAAAADEAAAAAAAASSSWFDGSLEPVDGS